MKYSFRHVRLPGDLCRPAHSAVSASRAWSPGGRPLPADSDVSWTLGSPAVRSSGTTIGLAASYEQPASILAYWAAPSLPDAVGARNGSQRVQTSPDPARRSQNLLAGEGLPVRLSPTMTDAPEFPDAMKERGLPLPVAVPGVHARGCLRHLRRWEAPGGSVRRPADRGHGPAPAPVGAGPDGRGWPQAEHRADRQQPGP